MGLLVNGEWSTSWYDTESTGGRFARQDSRFRAVVSASDVSADHPAEAGRYHLYVSLACPWAHRTLIVRRLKRLDRTISVTVVDPRMGQDGWAFRDQDPVTGARFLREIYARADPGYTGRVTVPVLWDRERRTIVNNESAEIIRMLNSAFDAWGDSRVDLYPAALRDEIDACNAFVYQRVNNGVYKAGFATAQEAYDEAVTELFRALDVLEERLGSRRYLAGDRLTEADWRLFTTLIRFDAVYHGHFKCNLRRLADYQNLSAYTRELYQVPGVAETVELDQIKTHYYWSHLSINPTRVIAKGPVLDLWAAHGRDRLPGLPLQEPAESLVGALEDCTGAVAEAGARASPKVFGR